MEDTDTVAGANTRNSHTRQMPVRSIHSISFETIGYFPEAFGIATNTKYHRHTLGACRTRSFSCSQLCIDEDSLSLLLFVARLIQSQYHLQVGEELERMHPKVFSGVARQLCRSSGGELESIESVVVTLATVSRDLFRTDITWSKVNVRRSSKGIQFAKLINICLQVIALFAVAAGLSVDCVRQNHPEYLPKLMEGIADVIEDELVAWINENGGWVSVNP